MKWLAIVMAIGSLIACSDGSPTAPTPPANIAGDYNANITASSTCSASLPSETRTLAFVAVITQTGAAVELKLVAKAPGNPSVTVAGTVAGQTVNFPSFSISQAVGQGVTLAASGNANVAANGLSINGTLNGTYETPSGSSCNAPNHQLELIKLCPQSTGSGTALLPCQ